MPPHRETLPSTTVDATVYTATIEISCPPFTELVIYADGRRMKTQTCPDVAWARRAYAAFLEERRG